MEANEQVLELLTEIRALIRKEFADLRRAGEQRDAARAEAAKVKARQDRTQRILKWLVIGAAVYFYVSYLASMIS
jgi:hypothetical protein